MRRSLRQGAQSALFIAVLVMTTAQPARSDAIAFTFQEKI